MTGPRYWAILPHLGAVAIVATATLIRMIMDPILHNRQPFAVYLVAVILAGRYCGFAPSLLALFLSNLASRYFFIAPRGSLLIAGSIEQGSSWFFVLIGVFLSFLMRAEQQAKKEARQQALAAVQKQQELEGEIAERKRVETELQKEQELLRNLIEVQEGEKQFLCHEFHDGLIQYAVGSLMSLEGYQKQHPSTAASEMIDTVIGSLRKGVEDGRRVIRGIRPAVLDDSGLDAAIEDLIGQFSGGGMMVTSKCDPGIGRLPDLVQTTVYRVVQEALNNARKYSGTDVVRIETKKANGVLYLEIRDFGCGFDVRSARKQGFGLLGMTERVRLLGGECQIRSEQDVGTHISVQLPIPQEETKT